MADKKDSLAGHVMDIMEEMEEEYRDVLDRRGANRRTLRDLAAQGLLSEAELKRVEEVYPPRERKAEPAAA